MKKNKPRILLVGAGRFGVNHLRILKKFHRKKMIHFLGVVVKTESSKKEIEKEHTISAWTNLSKQLLEKADAVLIITPAQTHYALVKKCLPIVDVFVEKPLALRETDAQALNLLAKKYKRKLMVGHIFRFNPLIEEIRKVISKRKVSRVNGVFTNSLGSHMSGYATPALEELHFFDCLDYLFEKEPMVIWSTGDSNLIRVDMRYPNLFDAYLKIGWEGDSTNRFLEITFKNGETLHCDFIANTIVRAQNGKTKRKQYTSRKVSLEKELICFLKILKGNKLTYPDGKVGERIVHIAKQASNIKRSRPSIGIIGGGIFGVTAALILGRYFPVTLFERHGDLLQETSWGNQYRNHMGYHYPRSVETIQEIKDATGSFESFYKKTLVSIKNYYCISRGDSWTKGKKFLTLCKKMGLPYKREYPPKEFLKRASVELCIKTPEKIFDYNILKKIVNERIRKNKNIALMLNTNVTHVALGEDGQKLVQFSSNKKNCKKQFDYMVNATYANHNVFCRWLQFPEKNVRIQFRELIMLKINTLHNVGVTVINGLFPTLLPMQKITQENQLFTLGDALLATHKEPKQYSDKDFRVFKKSGRTKWHAFRTRGVRWLPILKDAKFEQSMFTVLATDVISQKYDNRPTHITRHGFGCYSVLAGKVITCVQTAEEILKEIKNKK